MLHPHQHRRLVVELRRPEYAALSPDEAFALVNQRAALRRLGTTRFVTQAQLDLIPQKRRTGREFVCPESELMGFTGGVPGFPNLVKRPGFNAALAEVRS